MKPLFYLISISLFFEASSAKANPEAIRIALDQPPLTLNPRQALDANSQKLGALFYRSLTRLNARLEPIPDLAISWHSDQDFKNWIFDLAPSEDATYLAACFEQYRSGSPASMIGKSIAGWQSTRALSRSKILFQLETPDPYFPRNVTLLRYFLTPGQAPCAEPKDNSLIHGTGPYEIESYDRAHYSWFKLLPRNGKNFRPMHITYRKDELARLTTLFSGDTNLSLNGFSLSKTRWLKERGYPTHCWEGANIQYLSFRLDHPILSLPLVRQAIHWAIPRQEITEKKYFGFANPASSLIPRFSPDALTVEIPYQMREAQRLLDQAGLVPGKDGIRFRLKYITTTLRDGFELAQILQYFLRKVGIELEIDMTETGVFFDRIKKGQFDLYSSRWIGVADASILRRALHSKSPLNRIHYHSPAMDQLIEDRKVQEAQKLMLADLPYSPLWTWKSCIVETNDRFPFSEENFSRSGALDVLGKIYVSFDHDSTHSRSKSSGQSNSKPNP